MAACGNQLQRTMKQLKDATTPESKILALTSLRRVHLEDTKVIKTLKDEEFCELCNSVINASIIENDKLHIEACRTLDIILPETRYRNFDFFQSILQINRKKRLKILVSLSILKDETVATIASKMSIIDFLNNCMQSIKTESMIWLLAKNADNIIELRKMESKVLTENEEFEEKVVENSLKLLGRLCSLSSFGLNVRQFDALLMEKIIVLAYMGLRRQRVQALIVLKEAVQNDLGVRVRLMQKELWDSYKSSLQSIYCKRMTLLVDMNDQDWALQWETSIALVGTDLHRGSGLVNSLLKVEELAFKSADPNRRQAFISWKVLIDNFALDQRELATNRRIKLLCVPLNAKNSKTELMVLTKLEVWWHLIYKVYPSIGECIDTVLIPFLNMCYGPFGDKPLFAQKTDTNVSSGKKFPKTQVFAVYTFIQLIVDKESSAKISSPFVHDVLPSPVKCLVFQNIYKILIHCFGEILLSLGLLSDADISNKTEICSILWDSLLQRIEEYDKMKVSMYKEVMNVIVELMKHRFYKIPMIRDFLFTKILKRFDNISNRMQFNETTLMDLVQTFLQVENFSRFTSDHYQSIESLLWLLIKPKDADAYYPQTMEMLQAILKIFDDAKNLNSNMFAICEVWCILARIAKKYIEDSQNINEGTSLQHNFKTIESIVSFPFTHIFSDDHAQLKRMTETWIDLYKQFDFQAELIVSVQSNEIMNKTSNMIITALKKEKKCCDLATLCIDGLLTTVNYDHLLIDKEEPVIVQLLKDLIFQCLRSKSLASDKILKALCVFLLRVFSHSLDKTAQYLKVVEPAVKFMLAKTDGNGFDHEIMNTWSTIVGLFKKLKKSLDYELLTCYRKTIVLAVLHLNKEISSLALSLLDMKDSIDVKSKQVLEEVIRELEETSIKNNFEIDYVKEKSSKKLRSPHIKSVGSFLNRKGLSPSNSKKENGKENLEKKKVVNIEPDSQDFVLINSDVQLDVSRLTDHQKEILKKRRDDIPAMYNDLTVSNSQDSQELQHWFDTKTGKSPVTDKSAVKKSDSTSNSNDVPKATSATALHFKNIADVFSEPEKPSISVESPSPRGQTRKQQQQATDEDASTIEDSQVKIASVPITVKKLDFESREEFPTDSDQVSPSIIDNAKMRRRNPIEENNGAAVVDGAVDKNVRTTRRSLQPQQQRVTLRKFNSNEQLNTKRGRKRRNSESNSASVLNIVHEKRLKRDEIPERLNSSGESSKSNEENKTDIDGKKISKRQLNEMSRLKIDMRFESLPSRRSTGKVIENTASKDNKPKEEKTSASNNKNETNQQANTTSKRRSISKTTSLIKIEATEKEIEKSKRDGGHKKPATPENFPENNKLTTRKLLHDKLELMAASKKNEVVAETQDDDSYLKEDSTNMETYEQNAAESLAKNSESTNDDLESECIRSSQDSDIVESSQDPSTNSKLEKMDKCFIKIKKVEVVSITKNTVEEVHLEKGSPLKELKEPKELKVIDSTSIDMDEITPSPMLVATELEKTAPTLQEAKKVDSLSVKSSIPTSHISSPKSSSSRLFRSKVFPLQGRAAQMLGLVTKQSLTEKLSSEASKTDAISTDEVIVVPLSKRDKVSKENDRISSPSTGSSSGGSRQEKMFSNMNNNKRQEICLSPSITMFCNLKNDGERISPKLDKHERDSEVGTILTERETQNGSIVSSGDISPNGKTKRELPLLEWSNANPPSLTASPSVSILKKMQEVDIDTPSRKKRVSFADPPVSREMGYEIMTESSSPPKLEKLPTMRSPISRKESRKHAKLRLIQMDFEKIEKENSELSNNIETKPIETTLNDESANITTNAPMTSLSPKAMLLTAVSEISEDESKIVETESQVIINTQDVDIFSDNNVITAINESLYIAKTSTQNDHNNSSLKLDSINLSNILQKSSDNHITSLEDTVDVDNLSSSIEGTSSNLLDKGPPKNGTRQNADPGDTLPVTDSIFSNLPLSQETQNSVAQLIEPEALDSTLPVYPSLISCVDGLESISAELVDPLFTNDLAKHLSVKSIRSVGDLAQLTERDVNRLPIKSPKLACVKKALSRYETTKKLTRTPEKRSPTPKSSTPLGNKSKDSKTKHNILFDELMKNSSNNSDLASINVSALYDAKRLRKRQSTDSSMQTSPMKRWKINDEEACTEFIDNCNEQFLFNAFVKKFKPETILSAYKEKMGEHSDKELKKKTLDMLGLNIEDDSEASFKASAKSVGLQMVLQELPNIFDTGEEFYNSVVKSYKEELKDVIVDKLRSTELLTILAKRFSQEKKKDDRESIPNSNDLKVILDNVSPDSIMDQILSRNELMSSEVLLNIALENSSEKLSENAIQAMYKTLTDKLDICKLADLYHETIKLKVRQLQEK